MPAVMIRQLDALRKIMERAATPQDRQLLLGQAAMIERLSLASVAEESDRADIQQAYEAVLRASARGDTAVVLPASIFNNEAGAGVISAVPPEG
jgi:uncharacterized membrane protein